MNRNKKTIRLTETDLHNIINLVSMRYLYHTKKGKSLIKYIK